MHPEKAVSWGWDFPSPALWEEPVPEPRPGKCHLETLPRAMAPALCSPGRVRSLGPCDAHAVPRLCQPSEALQSLMQKPQNAADGSHQHYISPPGALPWYPAILTQYHLPRTA